MLAEPAPVPDAAHGFAAPHRMSWSLILTAVTAVTLAAAINVAVDGAGTPPEMPTSETSFSAFARLILAVGGLFAAGVALSLRPNRPSILALACLACLLARFGFHPAWDSGKLLAGFGAIVAGIA